MRVIGIVISIVKIGRTFVKPKIFTVEYLP